MRAALALLKRELLSLWVTPLAWILLSLFLVLQGLSFSLMVEYFSRFTQASFDRGPIQAYFESALIPLSLLILCPALSMRAIAEERRSGTLDMLLSSPLSPGGLVISKWLALWLSYLCFWLPTLLYAVILWGTGAVELAPLALAYLGVAMLGAAYLAIGVLASALCQSQLIAFMLSSAILFVLLVLGLGEKLLDPGLAREICSQLSVTSLLETMASGLVDSRRLVFYFSLTIMALVFAGRVMEEEGR